MTKRYVVSNEDGFRAFRTRWMAQRAFRAEGWPAILAYFDAHGAQHILDTNVSCKAAHKAPKPLKGQDDG